MIEVPEWRLSLEVTLKNETNTHTATYCQLASVDSGGHPRVRTMVWRGFDESDHGILMCTDAGSAKRFEFNQDSRAEIAWYFVDARQQFRLSGFVECLSINGDDLNLREQLWSKLSAGAKKSFVDNSMLKKTAKDFKFETYGDVVPEFFTVIKFQPVFVKKLDLRSEPHGQQAWQLTGLDWVKKRLVPSL
ncbi:MAG: pyridoxamine 5'-phosphate oxidase family protein [Gammaproteobacteria bacterium]|nr:pyridoxamine 5'-phosphate oxidase family protein [Gammaproteobacteria bacterium]